jgi:hypothetical protein
MKKITKIMTALMVVAMIATAGCRKQEGRQGEGQPGSAPTQTTPAPGK